MRLIDACQLIEAIKNYVIDDAQKGGVMIACGSFADGLATACKLADAADVIDPVKHGHWVEGFPTDTTDYFSCSVCNAGIFVDNSWRVSNKDVSEIYRYCRGCGAKMDETR